MVPDWIWPNFELIQALVYESYVIVTCKYEQDLIKYLRKSGNTIFPRYKFMVIFADALGHLTPQLVVGCGRILYFSKLSCMSLLSPWDATSSRMFCESIRELVTKQSPNVCIGRRGPRMHRKLRQKSSQNNRQVIACVANPSRIRRQPFTYTLQFSFRVLHHVTNMRYKCDRLRHK